MAKIVHSNTPSMYDNTKLSAKALRNNANSFENCVFSGNKKITYSPSVSTKMDSATKWNLAITGFGAAGTLFASIFAAKKAKNQKAPVDENAETLKKMQEETEKMRKDFEEMKANAKPKKIAPIAFKGFKIDGPKIDPKTILGSKQNTDALTTREQTKGPETLTNKVIEPKIEAKTLLATKQNTDALTTREQTKGPETLTNKVIEPKIEAKTLLATKQNTDALTTREQTKGPEVLTNNANATKADQQTTKESSSEISSILLNPLSMLAVDNGTTVSKETGNTVDADRQKAILDNVKKELTPEDKKE